MDNANATTSIVKETVEDIKKLVSLEIALLRAELALSVDKGKRLAVIGFLAGFGLIPASVFLGLFLSHSIQAATEMPAWQADLIVFALAILPSLILVYKFKKLYGSKS